MSISYGDNCILRTHPSTVVIGSCGFLLCNRFLMKVGGCKYDIKRLRRVHIRIEKSLTGGHRKNTNQFMVFLPHSGLILKTRLEVYS